MKTTSSFLLIITLFALSACIQPAPGVKVSLKLEPAPLVHVPMQYGPDAELKDLKNFVGDTVTTKGIVYGHKNSGDTIFVYMGAAYPHQQLTVLLTGAAKNAFTDMDNKSVYVAGCIVKHKGAIQMAVADGNRFSLKYPYR